VNVNAPLDSTKRIVLATINAKWIHPSLALRLLKANLGDLENNSTIMEFALRQPFAEKVQPILKANPFILGFSVYIWNHKATLELLEVLSAHWNSAGGTLRKPIVILGGPEVTYLPADTALLNFADYVIRGEGEDAFRTLCLSLLSGAHPSEKRTALNTVDIHTIKTAYHLYTDEDIQKKLIYVESSRGCAFACEFCQSSVEGDVQEFPLEAFLQEMGILIDRGVRTFKFLDRSFNLNIPRAIRIMEFFLERILARTENDPLCVHFEMLPFNFPPALLETLARFPPESLRIEIGLQTFNTETADLVNRKGNPLKELENLKVLRHTTNAILHADLIAGLPGENLTSFGTGFDQLWLALTSSEAATASSEDHAALQSAPFEIQLGILKCLPGTPIFRHNETQQMRYDPLPPYEVLETGALSAQEFATIKNFARFWELIVNRNPFPDLLPQLLPYGKPAFKRFMHLSAALLAHFGKNWGIDRQQLKLTLLKFLSSNKSRIFFD